MYRIAISVYSPVEPLEQVRLLLKEKHGIAAEVAEPATAIAVKTFRLRTKREAKRIAGVAKNFLRAAYPGPCFTFVVGQPTRVGKEAGDLD